MDMETLALFTLAAQEDKKKAARLFLARLTEGDQTSLEQLLDAAVWKERDLESFDNMRAAVPIDGEWGRFYLVSTFYRGDEEPRLTPRGLKALAQGCVDIISTEL